MVPSTKQLPCLASIALALFAVGCGSRDYSSVSGVVTFEGKPFQGATVVFAPTGDGPRSAGETGSDGRFVLSVIDGDQVAGAKVGSHQVTVSAIDVQQNSGPESFDSLSAMSKPPKVEYRLPMKYTTTETSGLTFEVKPGKNEANFDLVP